MREPESIGGAGADWTEGGTQRDIFLGGAGKVTHVYNRARGAAA